MDSNSYRCGDEAIDIDGKMCERLMSLSPETYIGQAVQIINSVIANELKQSHN